ncbi:cryptochrome/photolyase family protein [Adhaeribacter terreus]|uniref:Cryptochrome/photolyase family protein n=1 Tax=Adhaeribacter terreus TaxID=529703 RepID=A0ABW0EFJ9_9BACT
MNSEPISIFWFRRDLRLEDNAGLHHALKSKYPVLPLFIFDTEILDKLENRQDARVEFIQKTVSEIAQKLKKNGSALLVKTGNPEVVFGEVLQEYNVQEVYVNHDYEPYACQRDEHIESLLSAKNIPFFTFKDQVIFEKAEVVKEDSKPYSVYTPYRKKWEATLKPFHLKAYPVLKYTQHFLKTEPLPFPDLKSLGFEPAGIKFPSAKPDVEIIRQYEKHRDFPALEGTTRLGLHLRFGTISIRKLVAFALKENAVFLSELIWREFFMQILYHFPEVETQAFKPAYDNIKWRNNEAEFQRWCKGKTGFPLVDAGMRQMNETGFMHNRVRMVTASFLVKHLLIDWRWGEAYFAEKLLDYDLAANNGNWQWVTGCGCDAAPYFRIFNPESQLKKFDSKLEYVKKWLPELGSTAYPKPMVEHAFARERCLAAYKKGLAEKNQAVSYI